MEIPVQPIVLPRPTRGAVLERGAQTFTGGLRRLGPVATGRLIGRPVNKTEAGRALRVMFDRLGGTFSKLGQLIACAESIVGPEMADAFRGTLDRGPAVPFHQVRAVVESELGQPLDDLFATFDAAPLAAASIAVVHRATLPDGTPVAVKVLRPGIEELVATDLAVVEPLLVGAARQLGFDVARVLHGVVVGLQEQLCEELNLANEVEALEQFRLLLASHGFERITAPLPIRSHSSRRVLTMEYLDGVPIDDIAKIEALGVDPRPLVEDLVKAWFVFTLQEGVFHGDVHAGNLLLLRDGRVGVVDWGIVGRLDDDNLQFIRQAIRASLGDEEAWTDVARHIRKILRIIP